MFSLLLSVLLGVCWFYWSFQNSSFISWIFLYCFVSDFIISNLYYFPLLVLGYFAFLFLCSWGRSLYYSFETSLFSNAHVSFSQTAVSPKFWYILYFHVNSVQCIFISLGIIGYVLCSFQVFGDSPIILALLFSSLIPCDLCSA